MAKKKQTAKPAKKRAAIYCRVSTFDQNRGDYSSLEDQEQRLRRACKEDGYEIYRVYKEVGSSANLERDEIKKLLSKVDEFDAVYVTKLDRLSRSMKDWCRVNELLDKHEVGLVSVTQKIDTTTPMGRFFRDLLMLFAQFEREMISERTYEKMCEQARQGRWGGGHPILGYRAEEKRLIACPKESKVVQKIFAKYLEIASIAKTARWANEQGYRTKHIVFKNGREVKPKKFARADIQRMLSNILYIGKIRFDEMEFDGQHEGIVDEAMFTEVQKLLSAKRDKPRRGDQTQKVTLLLGLIKCDFCGSAYTSSFVNKKMKDGTKQRYYYYKCGKKTKRNAEACQGADLRSELVDKFVVDYFFDLANDPKKLKAVLNAASKASVDGSKEIEKQRKRATARLQKLEKDSMSLVDKLSDPAIAGLSSVKKKLLALEAEQKELQSQITDLSLQIRDRREQTLAPAEIKKMYSDFAGIWKELTFDERQYVIRLMIQEIRVRFVKKAKEGEFKIKAWGRSPKPLQAQLDELKKKLRNQDGWHPEQDSNLRPID